MLRGFAILLLGAAIGVSGTLVYQLMVANPQAGHLSTDPGSSPGAGQLGTEPRQSPARRSIMALGTIEPRDGIVQISSALVGYRIKQVHVTEGQTVKPGEILVELDAAVADAEYQLAVTRQAEALERQQSEVAVAKERAASAELAVRQAADGAPLEIEAQQSRIAVANLKVRQAQQDVEHLVQLRSLSEPLASEQQVQHQRIMLEGATAELEAAKVALKRLEQALKFQEQTAAAELRVAKQALEFAERGTGIESLKQGVALANLKLAQTRITSATAGTVLNITAHAGEVVAQQPLLQLADLGSLVCVTEIEAADVPLLEPNHIARVSCRAFQNTVLEGKLDHVGNRVSQAALRPLDPRQPVDRNVVRGVILIDSQRAADLINAAAGDRRSALIGLQVEVDFPLAGRSDRS